MQRREGGRREFFAALKADSRLLPIKVEFPPEAFALMRTAMEVPHRLTAAAKAGKALKRAKAAWAAGKAPWAGYNPNPGLGRFLSARPPCRRQPQAGAGTRVLTPPLTERLAQARGVTKGGRSWGGSGPPRQDGVVHEPRRLAHRALSARFLKVVYCQTPPPTHRGAVIPCE